MRQILSLLPVLILKAGRMLPIVAVNRTRSEMMLTMSKMEEILKSPLALGIPPATELAYLASTRFAPMVILQPQGIITQQFEILANQVAAHAAA